MCAFFICGLDECFFCPRLNVYDAWCKHCKPVLPKVTTVRPHILWSMLWDLGVCRRPCRLDLSGSCCTDAPFLQFINFDALRAVATLTAIVLPSCTPHVWGQRAAELACKETLKCITVTISAR